MPKSFSPMDGLTGQLWRDLQLAALPIRVVTREQFAEMTRHLDYQNSELPAPTTTIEHQRGGNSATETRSSTL
jgi:hypothetical protein